MEAHTGIGCHIWLQSHRTLWVTRAVFFFSDEWVGLEKVYASRHRQGKLIRKGTLMEYVPVLALILGVVKVTIMWLNYKECKRQKNTDCNYKK